MRSRELKVAGAWEFTPDVHADLRGYFLESYRFEALESAVGHRFPLAQSNVSVSHRGVVRGIHYALVPPGQAKYVTVVTGAAFDVIVDLRLGSPTFGQWDSVILDAVDHRAVYLPEGVGHAFLALEDRTTMTYSVSSVFDADREFGISVFDSELAIDWPMAPEAMIVSERDRRSPSLTEALAAHRLPSEEAWSLSPVAGHRGGA